MAITRPFITRPRYRRLGYRLSRRTPLAVGRGSGRHGAGPVSRPSAERESGAAVAVTVTKCIAEFANTSSSNGSLREFWRGVRWSSEGSLREFWRE